jgi:hypothetical protein
MLKEIFQTAKEISQLQAKAVAVQPVIQSAKKMIAGFNMGSMSHKLHSKYGNILGIPDVELKKIKAVTPVDFLEHHRLYGTMGNYSNLHEPGYGIHDNMIVQWGELYTARNNFLNRMNFTLQVLRKNRDWIFNQFGKISPESYLYDAVEIYKQTNAKTMAFSFNSHMPFIKWCTLAQSLESLKFVHTNTNVISIELENETYFADYIVGSNSASDHEPKIDKYIDYLENTVVPAIVKTIGKNIPLGISIANPSVAKFRYWNRRVVELYKRLTSLGLSVFLVPHIYPKSYTLVDFMTEFFNQIEGLPSDIRFRITEFNADPAAGKCSQNEALEYFKMVISEMSKYNVDGAYYHTLRDESIYSFVK